MSLKKKSKKKSKNSYLRMCEYSIADKYFVGNHKFASPLSSNKLDFERIQDPASGLPPKKMTESTLHKSKSRY